MRPLILIVLLFLTCSPAIAAQESGGFPWQSFYVWIVPALVALLGFIDAWKGLRKGLGVVFDWLAAKTHIRALAELDEVLVGFAIDLYQRQIKELKAAGGWNKDSKARFLEILVDQALAHFGVGSLRDLVFEDSKGAPHPRTFLRSRAQVAIATAKARGRGPRVNPTDPSQ